MTLTKDHNNHPAHAPLTSRRLHQMRDILSKAAEQRDGGDIGYAMSDAVKLIDEVLAGRDETPVLYAAEETLAYAKMGELHLKCLSQPMGDAVIPLYAAPPVPVVPEPIKRNDADGWWMYKGRRVGGGCAEWYNRALDDCRAAMLQGGTLTNEGTKQAGNSPVSPDGWVMVPVEPTEVMLDAAYSYPSSTEDRIRKQYGAMISAAPKQDDAATSSSIDKE